MEHKAPTERITGAAIMNVDDFEYAVGRSQLPPTAESGRFRIARDVFGSLRGAANGTT
jgi:hypothetical protein